MKIDLFRIFNVKPSQRVSSFLDLAPDSLPIVELYAQAKSLLDEVDDIKDYLIKDKLIRAFPEHARASLSTLVDQPLDHFYEHVLNLSATSSRNELVSAVKDPFLCLFHRRFGKKAHGCLDPGKCTGPPIEPRERRSKN